MNRKRKDFGSPTKSAPDAKRPATQKTGLQPTASSSAPPQAEESWEHISEESGWTAEDCLNHKLTFRKKEDIKVTKDTLLQHIKRLRALGRHLLVLKEKYELDNEMAKGALEQEEKARAEEREELQRRIKELEFIKADLLSTVAAHEKAYKENQDTIKSTQKKLEVEEKKHADAVSRTCHLEAEQRKLQGEIADYKKQISTVTELYQHAQKYNAQLQEYNSKLQTDLQDSTAQLRTLHEEKNRWSEDIASVRGNMAALESQVAAAQSSASAADDARQLAVGDAGRLRGEVENTIRQRDQAQEEIAALRTELNRYKETTGKSVEVLERERMLKQQLESQSKVQVEFNCELQEEVAQLRAQLAMTQASGERQAGKLAELDAQRAALENALAAAEKKVKEGEIMRRKLHNTILELKGNIRVFCRVRPLAPDNPAVEPLDGRPLITFSDTGDTAGRGLDLLISQSSAKSPNKAPSKQNFAFDKVFEPSATQGEVFEEISQLVQSALDGYKVCIFAYGQTGSGKTHTMVGPAGDEEQQGIVPRAVRQLFDTSRELEEQGWTFEMKASMLEIYNEEVKDLLGKGPPAGKKHQILHDERAFTSVSFAEAIDCKRPERVRDLLAKATRMRTVGATAANEHSSRSHMVFTMNICGTNEASGQQINGVLNLIDLAGSERLSKSLATGDRLKETQAINKSLSALGDVILALGNKDAHVPFRNSKLTYLLQPCLGGDAKTLMFVNIAPTVEAANESLCSLRFAAKVNATEIGTARRNVAAK